jgi:hypothetical protein
MNNKIVWLFVLAVYGAAGYAQETDDSFKLSETKRIEGILSSDNMQGRAPFTAGIDKAADFIAAEFKHSGIRPINENSYFQDFRMVWTSPLTSFVKLNETPVKEKDLFVLSARQEVSIKSPSDYELVVLKPTDDLDSVIGRLQKTSKTYLLQGDAAHRGAFKKTKRGSSNFFYSGANIVGVLFSGDIKSCEVNFTQDVVVRALKNVAGVLPGKSKKDEVVIFSAHYDHLGIGRPNAANDSIFNGANDDASGTTAVIMLAKYFAQRNDNERTLIFAAFTAEEAGGFGSRYFSQQLDPETIVAMFNIEMIGTDSKWGLNSAFITGYELTNMGAILQKNLAGSDFKFFPDPYPAQHLFFRSDNATLAMLGVPAHTISTSKMDSEKFYHTQDDEIGTLDLRNMTEIIRAIAISSGSIVAGEDTPTRVRLGK